MSDCNVVRQLTRTDSGDFEEDVMVDILARLPVKSLMRFRCVCKSWRALISDSHFAKKHLTYADRGVTKLNFTMHPPLFLDLEAFKNLNDVQSAVTKVDFPVLDANLVSRFSSVVGACNGLLCVNLHHKALLLWNPCTRDSKVFVLPSLCLYEANNPSYFFCGFGYDSASDDYKFLRGFSYDDPNGVRKISGHIFSMKTGSRRKVNDIDDFELQTHEGLFVNGALHWLHLPPVGGGTRILSFDLGDEKFHQTIPLPYDDMFYDPITYQNCLCVCALPTETNTVNIWMMKEYGVKESWTEVLRFSLENSVEPDDELRRSMELVCILENGVVMIDRSEGERLVVLSNLKEKMHVAEVMKMHPDDYPGFETVIFRETLVSPIVHTYITNCESSLLL